MYDLKYLIVLVIFIVNITKVDPKDNYCYTPKFLQTSWTDRRPDFKINMTFNKQGVLSTLSWFEKDILSPVVRLEVLQKDSSDKTAITLYNLKTRLCDIQQFIGKLPMFKETILKALKQGNLTYECPLRRGYYVMDNIRVHNRNPLLAMLYRPNRTFTFIGGLYEELANKSLLPLTTYRFTTKISRKVCEDF